jgi:hypothetical protein
MRVFAFRLLASSLVMAAGPALAQTAAPDTTPPTGLARWLDVETATLSTRYRRIENSLDALTANHEQHREEGRLRLRLDPAGHFGVTWGVASGESFISGWEATGLGTGAPVWRLFSKQLFADYTRAGQPPRTDGFPTSVQVGGLYVVRGENTEITSYDNDGYLTGFRLGYAHFLGLDQFTWTNGTIGTVAQPETPNVITRFDDLGYRDNYTQILLAKRFGAVATSSDMSWAGGARVIRAAATIHPARMPFVDLLRFENYYRTNDHAAYGYSAYVERHGVWKTTLGGGVADIDRHYGTLNGDRFGIGRRVFGNFSVPIGPTLSFQLFGQHAFHNDFAIPNESRFDAVMVWNLKSMLPGRHR